MAKPLWKRRLRYFPTSDSRPELSPDNDPDKAQAFCLNARYDREFLQAHRISPPEFCTSLLVVAGSLTAIAIKPIQANKKAHQIQAINSARTIKVGLDSFTIDNDGVYPSAESAPFYGIPIKDKTSNTMLKQLIAAPINQALFLGNTARRIP